jgi:hypothetical protein
MRRGVGLKRFSSSKRIDASCLELTALEASNSLVPIEGQKKIKWNTVEVST